MITLNAATLLLLSMGCHRNDQQVSSAFQVRESVEQLHVWSADPGTELEVVDLDGQVLAQGTTDYQGSLIFRALAPGQDYSVRLAATPEELTDQLTVMSIEASLPLETFYSDQELLPGNGYITTRDGTQLSYYIYLPGPVEDGPYPTIVNYSGYSPSQPGESLGESVEGFCELFPILCDAPSFPTGIMAGVMGYAVVGVNVRGTGCSGGAYDYFETLQLLDGYDVIETVAAQEWVLHNKVGMAGLSFPGITQLFVAQTQPPHLAAITPFSVIGDTTTSTLIPGGIFNEGFAEEWYDGVLSKALPYGHDWIQEVVDSGDTVCEENQLLHSQLRDQIQAAKDSPFYSEEVSLPLDPSAFVDQISVPVYLTGQWQDEQTGPHFAVLFDKFESAPIARFTATNGVHVDGFSPQNLVEWKTFLDLYVAKQVPYMPPSIKLITPMFMERVFGDDLAMPPIRFQDYTDYESALADYEAEPPVRIIFETGTAEGVQAGAPEGAFETQLQSWPPSQAVATRWYLQSDGSLSDELPPQDGGLSSFLQDPDAGARGSLASGSVNPLQPDWDFAQPLPGHALSYLGPVLEQDLVVVGHGSVDLWLMSSDTDADIEVTISEVRPDGQEAIVQHGWLRASQRALRQDATELRPAHTQLKADVQPLVPGEWTLIRVEIMPHGHVFRAGSQLRLSIDTPGDSMARWRFDLVPFEQPPTHSVAHNQDQPSSLVLSVLPDVLVPTPLPACDALRGQPCRDYVEFDND